MKQIGDLRSLSDKLRLARKQRGLSATETGSLIGRSRAYIERIERGNASHTALIELIQLAACHHVSLIDVLRLKHKPTNNNANIIIIDSNVQRSLRTEKLVRSAYANTTIKRFNTINKSHHCLKRHTLNLAIVMHNKVNNAHDLVTQADLSQHNRGLSIIIVAVKQLEAAIKTAQASGNLFHDAKQPDDVLITMIKDALVLT